MLRQSFTYPLASFAQDAVGPAARLSRSRSGLGVHDLRVLRLIGDPPGVTFARLARQTKFERSAASRILSRLLKASLARREIDADDARPFRLRVTEKARALRECADPLSLEREALILSASSAAERREFRRRLDRLSARLNSDVERERASPYPEAGPLRRASR